MGLPLRRSHFFHQAVRSFVLISVISGRDEIIARTLLSDSLHSSRKSEKSLGVVCMSSTLIGFFESHKRYRSGLDERSRLES